MPSPLRADPTKTTMIRRGFMADVKRRVKTFKVKLKKFLVTDDELALKPAGTLLTLARKYEFSSNPEKVRNFRKWVEENLEGTILGSSQEPWATTYIESGYRKGLENAYLATHREGAVGDPNIFTQTKESFLRDSFSHPETLEKVKLLAVRAYDDLAGITSAMSSQMSRILAQGLVDGRGVVDLMREMSGQIDGMTRRRALVIARTEVIRAHAEGQLDAFDRLGIDELGLMSEWSTAGDERVCPECSAKEGNNYTVAEARGLIPLHPNCRCTWIPSKQVPKSRVKSLADAA